MDRIPIVKVGDCLLVSIQVDMHDRMALALQEDLTSRIVGARARGVLIDISALEIVDSFIGRMLGTIAGVGRVLDARTIVVGMRPAVAITLVELGLSLPGVRTSLNVDKGMELLRASRTLAIAAMFASIRPMNESTISSAEMSIRTPRARVAQILAVRSS